MVVEEESDLAGNAVLLRGQYLPAGNFVRFPYNIIMSALLSAGE